MAKTRFSAETTGLSEYIENLGRIVEEFPVLTKGATEAQLAVVEQAVKDNWTSIAGGSTGDFVYDSIGKNVEYGANGTDTVGMVGVFHIDSVASAHGRVQEEGGKKPLRASQIAYWVEFGTQRLKSGQRKVKNVEYPEEELAKAVTGKPFLTNAGYATINEQQEAFMNKMDDYIDRLMK